MSNVVVLVTTLTAMFLLQWQITLIALVLLPIFIIPAKRVGPQDCRRSPARASSSTPTMNTQMTERFNVSGAQLVKLFGDYDREVDHFSDAGRQGARHRRAQRHVRAGLLHRPGAGRPRSAPPPSTASAATWSSPARISLGTLVAMAAFVTQIYAPAHRASPTPGSTS